MASIFVQIAAYRDKELTPTILDAIEKSSGKHEINFGVHIIYLNSSEIKLPDIKNEIRKVLALPVMRQLMVLTKVLLVESLKA